jgi:hypothetical protein
MRLNFVKNQFFFGNIFFSDRLRIEGKEIDEVERIEETVIPHHFYDGHVNRILPDAEQHCRQVYRK